MARRRTPVPRYRGYAGPAILSQGFRPFFVLACGWSAAAMALWGLQLGGLLALPTALPGAAWHAHTMIAGYLGAALAGYALMATPNRTGRLPLQGRPLAALVALWGVGRAVNLFGAGLPPAVVAAADAALPLVLLAAVGRELRRGRGWRGLAVAGGVAGLAAATGLSHLLPAGAVPGARAGVAVFAVLIAVVGGRLIPSLTATTLRKRGARPPASRNWGDVAAEAAVAVAAGAWLAAPAHPGTAVVAAVACGLNGWRLVRWRGWAVAGDPGLAGLHLGYLWLTAGLGLMAAGAAVPAAVPGTAALHALTAGAMGCVPLAVMAQLGLAHACGRMRPGWPVGAALGLIAAAALARVLAPAAPAVLYAGAAALWAGGFALAAAYLAGVFGRRRSPAAPAKPRKAAT